MPQLAENDRNPTDRLAETIGRLSIFQREINMLRRIEFRHADRSRHRGSGRRVGQVR